MVKPVAEHRGPGPHGLEAAPRPEKALALAGFWAHHQG